MEVEGGGGSSDTSTTQPEADQPPVITPEVVPQSPEPEPEPEPDSTPESQNIQNSGLLDSLTTPIAPIEVTTPNPPELTSTPTAAVTNTTTVSTTSGATTTTVQTTSETTTTSSSGSAARLVIEGPIYETTDYFGGVRLYGIVKNTGGSSAVFAKVDCDFIKADSSLIESAFGYIDGDNLTSTNLSITTNTAILPGGFGYFQILTDIKPNDYATYDCDTDWNVVRNMKTPEANLELVGNVNVQKSYFEDVEYLGRAKNTGTRSLIFGKAIFITKNTASEIIDISSGYIDGDTIYISTINDNTDTGLNADSTGSFESWTSVDFNDYGEHIVLFSWDDLKDSANAYQTRSIKRRPTIDEMREVYLMANEL